MRRGKFELNYEQVYRDAKGQGAELQLEDELYSFSRLIREHYEFKLFLEDPRLAAEYKKGKLKELCPPGTTNNFFSVVTMLIDHGREELIEELSKNFTRRLFQDEGVLFGEVSSVAAVPVKAQARLQSIMSRVAGAPVKLRYNFDPELLGGLSVKFINGKMWDASLRRELADLRSAIVK
ncbi:MAG: ATP synthase F1 subunit delta [Candidatus Margulisbacteria bacterium]|nr:ATP synthase F1 subunit delta [Candidatus Margulisiibacteriota bacterium]